MGSKGVTEGWIAKFNTELQVNTVPGDNGQMRQAKTIMFSVGTRRSYYSNVRGENGQMTRERLSDFPVFRANGELAQSINDNLNLHDAQGKLISRRVLIFWEEISYSKERPIVRQETVNIGGQLYKIDLNFTVPQTNFIKIVREITFLDSNPTRNNVQAANPTGQPVGTTYPTATPVAATPVQAYTQPQAAPVQAANPYANVASQGYSIPVQQAAQVISQAFTGMNPPGEELPFDDDYDPAVQQIIEAMGYQATTSMAGATTAMANELPTPAGLPESFKPANFDPNGASAPC